MTNIDKIRLSRDLSPCPNFRGHKIMCEIIDHDLTITIHYIYGGTNLMEFYMYINAWVYRISEIVGVDSSNICILP